MKKFLKLKSIFILTILATAFVACSDDDNDPVNPPMEEGDNIVDLAVATADLSNLVAALQEANLVSTLEGDGPFTVFAPTNAAFEAFLTDNGFASVEDVPDDILTAVLLNHVVSGEAVSTSLSTGYISSLSTAGPDDQALSLYVNTANGVQINNATVSTADIDATNGVVHIVDQVIGLPNIVNHALFNENLSELVGALTADDNTTFTDLLSQTEEVFTVFAPVNSGFASFENPAGNDINNVLSNHVIVGAAAFSGGLSNSYQTTAATNGDDDAISLYVNTDDGVTLNGTSNVAIADIVATNGVIHAVDNVIDIPTVVTFALADPNFSTLVTALTELTPATPFADVLSTADGTDPAPFTVFAPTNDAFAAITIPEDEDTLTAILNHHVVGGANVRSGDLTPDGTTPATTLEGDDIQISLPGTDGNIADVVDGAGNDGIGIIAVDVQAGNGVIHVLNAVLIPNLEN